MPLAPVFACARTSETSVASAKVTADGQKVSAGRVEVGVIEPSWRVAPPVTARLAEIAGRPPPPTSTHAPLASWRFTFIGAHAALQRRRQVPAGTVKVAEVALP